MQKNRIKFKDPSKSTFHKDLQRRVNRYFKEHKISRYGNATMKWKSVILLSTYLVPFVLMCTGIISFPLSLLLWVLMGLGMAGVGMSVMHDANHGAYSQKKWVNRMMGGTLYLLGGSKHNWKLQHNILHHTYTNVYGMDDDIEDKLILSFNPHTESKWYHKLQVVYAFAFYAITTLYWVTLKDFVQYVKYNKNQVNSKSKKETRIELFKIIISKVVYFAVVFGIPTLITGIPFWQILVGFLLMHAVSGVVLTTTFQLAHSVNETDHPLPNEEGIIEDNWAKHQMRTTVNFSRKNRFLTWYMGGLNFQVEHHLFPNICHVHYPKISKIVEEVAEEHDVPYLDHGSLWEAFLSHLGLMRKIAK